MFPPLQTADVGTRVGDERTAQMNFQRVPEYVGHVERDAAGALWVVLYRDGKVLRREQTGSLRQGKRRATDLVLAAADSWAQGDPVWVPGPALPEQAPAPTVESIDPATRALGQPGRPTRRTRPPFHSS